MRLRARLSIAVAMALIVFLILAKVILGYVSPFLLALFFAAVIDPIVDRLERSGVSRGVGAFVVIGSFLMLFVGVGWIIAVNLAQDVALLKENLPAYADVIRGLVVQWTSLVELLFSKLPPPLDEALLNGSDRLVGLLSDAASDLLIRAGAIPGILVILLVAAVATYFLSRDKRELGQFLLRFLPTRWHGEVRRLKEEITSGLLGFVRAQCILVAISGGLSVAGLHLFGYRYAWLLGILAGVLDLVPMVGPSGVFVPLILSGALIGDWPRTLGVGCVWLTVLVVRQIVEPDVVGRHVGLHPLTSLVAIYLGGVLLGVHGMLLGPIIAITVKAICVVSILPHLKPE